MTNRLRAISGSILFAFLTCHLLNHAFGLQSLDAMDAAHTVLMEIWRTMPGTALLGAAFFTHYGIALAKTYRRRSLAMSRWEILQLVTGLIFPFLIVEHILGTRVAEELAGVELSYAFVVAALWVVQPISGILQVIAVIVGWTHGCVGLHFWLRTTTWYERARRPLIFAAIVLPVLSLSGFVSAGFQVLSMDEPLTAIRIALENAHLDMAASITALLFPILGVIAVLSILPFAARIIRDRVFSRTKVLLKVPDGAEIPVPEGATALEALRAAGRPHAAVCGGRGRCTTCRVRVLIGADLLAEPEPLEATALKRIKALEGVRLACQIRPRADLGISPLLPPTADARDGRRPGGLEGEERNITCLFIDIRGSTRLGEEKLPFDVLFILNQFFSEMSRAIEETGGHYAQFNGDGLMALYGLETTPEAGARAAVEGAKAMLARVERLNRGLDTELPFPLRVGIGLHFGEAIVGAMGPPKAQITSAIGDNINIAARLESLTKEYDAPLILSHDLAAAAGLDTGAFTRAEVPVRGRSAPVTFYAVKDVAAL